VYEHSGFLIATQRYQYKEHQIWSIVRLEPIAEEAVVQTNANILSALLAKELNVLPECGGRGICATCHVYIKKWKAFLHLVAERSGL